MDREMYGQNEKRILSLPVSGLRRTYGTMIRFSEKTRIHYETDIDQWRASDHTPYCSVNRKQVYINDMAPGLLIDKLADEMGKALYPVMICTDENGTMQGIVNNEAIRERWSHAKERIRQYYKGEIVDRSVAEMESHLYHASTLFNRLKEDWFFSLFFSGIYGLGPYDFRKSTLLELPQIPYSKPLKYAITREITEQHTQSKCLVITGKGTLIENRSAGDIAMKSLLPVHNLTHSASGNAIGEVNLKYMLYHKDFAIRSITGTSSFQHPQEGKQETSFEIYHLPEYDRPLQHYEMEDLAAR